MEKNEHAILGDIPGGSKNVIYHSAILTTYAIDLIHFDNQLLNMLHRKQICSVNVFVDSNQMDKSMEYVSPMFIQNLGKKYSITNVNSTGAFHPKINFFIGDEAVMVILGSGNLTVAGHGKNHEVFTGLMIDKTNKSHRPLIEECWQYLCQFTKQCDDFNCNRILKEIPENCIFLDPGFKVVPHSMHKVQDDLQAALLYNDSQSSILQQISKIVPVDKVKTITVLSPYFDEYGDSLIALANLCPNSKINVLIHKDCVLPPTKLPKNERINFFDFCETSRGKKVFKTYNRQLHAKVFHFKTKDSEYCVIGSANATKAGLGTMTKRGINEEFGVLYYSKTHDFLSLLGLKTKKRINVPDCKESLSSKSTIMKNQIRLLSAQYEGGKLSILCGEKISKDTHLVVDNGCDPLIVKVQPENGNRYVIDSNLDNGQYICYLVNKDNICISNKIFLNWPELLATTNPSITSRNLNRFISLIENVGYNGIEVVYMLSDVLWNLIDHKEEVVHSEIKNSTINKRHIDRSLPQIAYNPDYDNDEARCNRTLHIDNTSRLIECIEDSLRKKIHSINDSIYDEEEDGSAETSNPREIYDQEDIYVSNKEIKGYGEKAESLLMTYQKMIDKRYEQVRLTGNDYITKDDLNFFSLSMFTAMEICWLNKSHYKFDHIAPISRSQYQKQFYDSLERSISNIGLATIEKFVKFCCTLKKHEQADDNYNMVALRTMKYVILYGCLFDKLTHFKTIEIKRERLLNAINSLVSLFGRPSIDYLKPELEPLAKRYDYVFRMSHIEYTLQSLS